MFPVYVPTGLQEMFEKNIVRGLNEPSIWHEEFSPIDRLYLLYGQPGSGMGRALYSLLKKHGIQFVEFIVSRDAEETKQRLEYISKLGVQKMLVIRNVHLLFYHRALLTTSCHLKQLSYIFIIGISEEPLSDSPHPFWQQFKRTICMTLPGTDHYMALIKYYFEGWCKHWQGRTPCALTDADYKELANHCISCTPRMVKQFCRRVFQHVRDAYPEQKIEITREYLEDTNNLLMYKPFPNARDVLCIVNEDACERQKMYDPSLTSTLSSMQVATKRARTCVQPQPDDTSVGFLAGGGGEGEGPL